MNTIRTFDIELDISDRQLLYDYGQGKVVSRPRTGHWDAKSRKGLQRHASTDHMQTEDENFMLRVGLMDRTWMDADMQEKKFDRHKGLHRQEALPETKEEEEEEEEDEGLVFSAGPEQNGEEKNRREGPEEEDVVFGADLNSLQPGQHIPRRLLPVYHTGERIKGVVLLDVSHPLHADSLTINFLGQVRVNIRTYNQFGSEDNNGTDNFVDESHTLWETAKHAPDLTEAFSELSVNSKAVSKHLPVGVSHFPFEFTLPSAAPGSIPPLIPSTVDSAFLVYRFKATLNKVGKLFRGNAITHRGIWVEHPLDISHLREFKSPANVERILDSTLAHVVGQGQVMVRVSLPRKAWTRGELVMVNIEVDNLAKSEITAVKARVILHGKVQTSETHCHLTHPIRIKSKKVKDGPVPPGKRPRYQWQVPLDFSQASVDSNLVPAGQLHVSKLLDLRYDVVVKIKRKGLHRNMELTIPIVVGTCNTLAAHK